MVKNTQRTPGRPKDPQKRGAILDAAGCLFMENGFDRTTVDSIAARAGVSKLTVYSHFADKETLFRELVSNKCEQHFEGRSFTHLADLEPEDALTRIGNGFMGLMFSPEVLALHRVLIASAAHDPQINRTFYETGPGPIIDAIGDLLSAFNKQGKLKIAKPRLASDHFLSMMKGDLHLQALLNVGAIPTQKQLKDYVKDCVGVFLRAYARNQR